jgi:hypothetical protein
VQSVIGVSSSRNRTSTDVSLPRYVSNGATAERCRRADAGVPVQRVPLNAQTAETFEDTVRESGHPDPRTEGADPGVGDPGMARKLAVEELPAADAKLEIDPTEGPARYVGTIRTATTASGRPIAPVSH